VPDDPRGRLDDHVCQPAGRAAGRPNDRLTPAGQLLADRAGEIIGRIDAADAELAAHVGLTAGRVRLAGFSSAIGSFVPRAVAALAGTHPGCGSA
jgi:DNA-binding transcriptional LysR family regulator